jgi:ubiquinone biosynthesis protein
MRDAFLDLRRAVTVLRILVTHILAPAVWDRFRRRSDGHNSGVRLRRALEDLGLTYLKLGQYLAMRDDVLPPAIARELRQLLERVRPVPFAAIKDVVESELAGPLEAVYREFKTEPIASASVAQVHEAHLLNGQRVAVKVQRPGIRQIFQSDVRILHRLATVADVLRLLGTFSAADMVDQFVAWTLPELDFVVEGTTADRLRRNALPYERVPLVYWEQTTRRVLTLEFIDGLSLAELSRIFDEGGEPAVRAHLPHLDLRLTLRRFSFANLRQLYVTGFFHGDPHPGNIIVRDDNTIAFVDFGIFGELSPYERLILRRHVEAMAMGRIQESLHYYVKQLVPTAETDERAFRAEAIGVLRRWYQASSDNAVTSPNARRLASFAGDMAELIRRHKMQMGWSSLLFWRALNALDATASRFPGYFDLLETLRVFFEPGPAEIVERVLDVGRDPERAAALASLMLHEPRYLTDVLDVLVERQPVWQTELEESPVAFRANNRRARGLAFACVGLSLALLGLMSPLDGSLRALALAVAMPVALWSVAELRVR